MMERWREYVGDLFVMVIASMILFACVLGLVALGKEIVCFILAGCGG